MENYNKFNHKDRDLIFGSLSKATSVESIENVFNVFGIDKNAYIEKANALIEFQKAVSYSSPHYQLLEPKEKYRNEIAIFLTFEWKKSDIYAAGINSYNESKPQQ